jgi:hypothetical protein
MAIRTTPPGSILAPSTSETEVLLGFQTPT